MADDFTKELLSQWNMGELIDSFNQNGIDKTVMYNLTSETLQELIPKIGTRVKFTIKWKNHFSTQTLETNEAQSSFSTTNKTCSGEDVTMEQDAETDNEIDSKEKENWDYNRTDTFVEEIKFDKKSFNLRRVLQKSAQGSAILTSYMKCKLLSHKARNIIIDLLMREILNSARRLNLADFVWLAQEIVKIFPTEDIKTYYIPPIRKRDSENNKCIIAKGKLVAKYRNLLQQHKKLLFNDPKPTDVTREAVEEGDPTVKESQIWLQSNRAPWELVLHHWENTVRIRREQITNSKEAFISKIYEAWPVLTHPEAYILIDSDFSSMALTSFQNNISTWNLFFTDLKLLCPLNSRDYNATSLNDLIELETISDDTKVAAQLLLLPHLVPPKGRIRLKKKHWKPSIGECKDSLIVHAKLAGDVTLVQQRRSDIMKQWSLPLQPFIIVVGPSITDISAAYVCIDKILYNVPSTIYALDICFKTFHVLHAGYPPESKHLWLLIQRGLYNFKTKWDDSISYVNEIIGDLESRRAIDKIP